MEARPMATELTPAHQTASTLTTAAEQSLRRDLDAWTVADPLPANLDIDALRLAYRKAETALLPASPEAVMVLLDRLWATLPMPKVREKGADGKPTGQMIPDKAAIAEWKRHLSRFPEDLLAKAIDAVVLSHKWETLPKVAQVVDAMRDEMDERTAWRNKVRNAGMKAKMSPPTKAGGTLLRDMTPEDREAFFARLREQYPLGMGAAPARSSGVPLYPDEVMSAAEKERARAASLRRAGAVV
jgi:hypothetical protein